LQPPEVHAAVHRINAMLGNVGKEGTIAYTRLPDPERPSYIDAMRALVGEMNDGKVNTLLILGGDPVYNAPADLAFGEALNRVETSIHLSGYRDETSRCCTWHLPRAHFLETWGDGRSYDGTYSVIQPVIVPLRNGRSPIEVLSTVLSSTDKEPVPQPEELVRQTFQEQIAGNSVASWQQVLRDGLLVDSRWPVESVADVVQAVSPVPKGEGTSDGELSEPPDEDGRIEVIFRGDRSVFDGRFANNSWLQELPDPVTKLTWGGAALLGPATAAQLGIKNEDVVVLKLGDRQVRIPVCVLPGQAAGTVELSLGYGRWAAGKVGGDLPEVETVGVDVYPLRTTTAM
jgi:anaerobic selenocysteine-containing dehydrogenase